MNKTSIDKLGFFFLGLGSRFEENIDIFKSIEVAFTAGLKTFKGNGRLKEDGTLGYNFNGQTKSVTFPELTEEIKKEAAKYDSVRVVYEERGSRLVITGDSKNVNMTTENLKQKEVAEVSETSSLLNRDYYIKAKDASKLLMAIDIMSKDGKVKNNRIRKYNQIDHYVELLDQAFAHLKRNETVNILDVGCGKSYLSFVLNYYLTEVKRMKCHFIGIDISPQVIESSEKIRKELGYRNMEFHAMDIKDFKDDRRIHAVLSLHACDTATDMALAFGVVKEADLIVAVPCCHKEMLSTYSYEPFRGIMKHGILKARLADTLTDGLRGLMLEAKGYEVSIVEYISPLETPKNLMIRAYRTGKENAESDRQAEKLISDFGIYPAFKVYVDEYTYGESSF
jgi:SAM-dependent methyltransferase